MTEHTLPITIKAKKDLYALAFSASGEHLFSGGSDGVEVWRGEDGERVATMTAKDVECLAVSKNGRWVAGGTSEGAVFVWDAKIFKFKTVWQKIDTLDFWPIQAVDFSVDSTKVISGTGDTATIWDLEEGKQVITLAHKHWVTATKYSPDGERIATATPKSVHLWDADDGRLLLDIQVEVTPLYNNGLVWFDNHILVVSGDKIKQYDTLAGSIRSLFPISKSDRYSSVDISTHGKFIAYSTGRSITLSDSSAHSQLGVVERPEKIRAVALSPNYNFLAIGHQGGRIIAVGLSRGPHSLSVHFPHPTLRDVDVKIDPTAKDAWRRNELDSAEAALIAAVLELPHLDHHLHTACALIRARLGHFDAALVDANMAIRTESSFIAYIAKSVAHVGKGEKDQAYRACDIAFEHFHSTHVTLLLVIKAIIVFMAGEHHDAISRMDDLIATVRSSPSLSVIQAYMHLLMGDAYMKCRKYGDAIRSFERASAQVLCDWYPLPSVVSLITGWTFKGLHITVRQRLCKALWAAGCKKDAAECLLEMVDAYGEEVYMSKTVTKWVSQFTRECLSIPEVMQNTARHINIDSLAPHPTVAPLLRQWAKATLTHDSWEDALRSADNFVAPRILVIRVICECLKTDGRTMDASECFFQVVGEFGCQEIDPDEQAKWGIAFKHHCCEQLENLGDAATNDGLHKDAVSHYLAALSLRPAAPQDLLVKRSKAYLTQDLCKEALRDANEAIEIDPSSPWGYERKHAALHQAKDYQDAADAFETMLSKISQSPDEEVYALRGNYISPADTREAIRRAVQDTLRGSPRVLIHTSSGRLCDKSDQAASFESDTIFNMLVSSMTTYIDHARIEQEVQDYYCYGMFSHKWEANEPLFKQVSPIVVYDLEEYPTHDKLKMFCEVIREEGLHWAWSDTCCINKEDNFVLQEALVSMFKWYQNSSLTVVFLFDVLSPSRRGDLMESIWNSRAWTFQEYHASKVVRFYTKDWKPYLNLEIPNHKESSEIISEMEKATGVSAQALIAIQPGLDDIREKLCLASTRNTTLTEDAAYSLLGIFSISLPVVYGEGDHALGRLLAQVLTSSGDITILAWTGKSGSFNSCLPTNITVFRHPTSSHIPPVIASAEMENITKGRSSSVMRLYNRLHDLPSPLFVGQRLKLPCLRFKLGAVTVARNAEGVCIFRSQTDMLGIVEIRTEADLSRFNPLYLVHPWIDFLLDERPIGSIMEAITEESTDGQSSMLPEQPLTPGPSNTVQEAPPTPSAPSAFRFRSPLGGLIPTRAKVARSLRPPSSVSPAETQTRALHMMARLHQPFGALLLTENPGKTAAYKRVAADTLIKVQVEEITPAVLKKLLSSVHVLDVL